MQPEHPAAACEAAGLDRRRFLKQAAALSGLALAGGLGFVSTAWGVQRITQPPLPYPEDALAPAISARTVKYHYGKHHNGYVMKTNKLLEKYNLAFDSLEAIVVRSKKDPKLKALYNNASQVWNHNFYWRSMKPGGGGEPRGQFRERLEASFGSFDAFKDAFAETALGRFGSGWAWLVMDGPVLSVESTPNACSPLPEKRPLLVCDV
jgi:Fe-Mn family superoxide dismutase